MSAYIFGTSGFVSLTNTFWCVETFCNSRRQTEAGRSTGLQLSVKVSPLCSPCATFRKVFSICAKFSVVILTVPVKIKTHRGDASFDGLRT